MAKLLKENPTLYIKDPILYQTYLLKTRAELLPPNLQREKIRMEERALEKSKSSINEDRYI